MSPCTVLVLGTSSFCVRLISGETRADALVLVLHMRTRDLVEFLMRKEFLFYSYLIRRSRCSSSLSCCVFSFACSLCICLCLFDVSLASVSFCLSAEGMELLPQEDRQLRLDVLKEALIREVQSRVLKQVRSYYTPNSRLTLSLFLPLLIFFLYLLRVLPLHLSPLLNWSDFAPSFLRVMKKSIHLADRQL